MIIDISRLLNRKVTKLEIDSKFEYKDIYYENECFQFNRPIEISGLITQAERVISFDLVLKSELTIPCSRCTEKYNFDLDIEIHEKFSADSELIDDEILAIEGTEIDLSDIIENNIIASLPIQKLCKDNCKGLCHICGTNLNNNSCDCKNEELDPRLEKLRNLFSTN